MSCVKYRVMPSAIHVIRLSNLLQQLISEISDLQPFLYKFDLLGVSAWNRANQMKRVTRVSRERNER